MAEEASRESSRVCKLEVFSIFICIIDLNLPVEHTMKTIEAERRLKMMKPLASIPIPERALAFIRLSACPQTSENFSGGPGNSYSTKLYALSDSCK